MTKYQSIVTQTESVPLFGTRICDHTLQKGVIGMDAKRKEGLITNGEDVVLVVAPNNPKPTVNPPAPPDGGIRAWLVMLASFLCNGIIFGIINSFGVIFVYIRQKLVDSGDDDAATKGSLVGALAIGHTFLFSVVAGILVDKVGVRTTAIFGAALATLGMTASSFLTDRIEALCITYGVMFGIGASLVYTPSLVILGHYFKKRLGIVNGIVTAGSSVFTIILPFLIESLNKAGGLQTALLGLSALNVLLIFCSVVFRPLVQRDPVASSSPERSANGSCSAYCGRFWGQFINYDVWNKKKYVIWALSIPLALFGYFVPYVHIVQYVKEVFPHNDGKILILTTGIGSGIGRIIFGKVADVPGIDRILLQQISFVSIGLLTMLIILVPSFWMCILIAAGMGIFDGCFISLLGPIAFDICGPEGASQAIGNLLALCSIPLTIGPPFAGYLFDHLGSYKIPFLLAGCPPLVGAAVMCLIRRVKPDISQSPSVENGTAPHPEKSKDASEESVLLPGADKKISLEDSELPVANESKPV